MIAKRCRSVTQLELEGAALSDARRIAARKRDFGAVTCEALTIVGSRPASIRDDQNITVFQINSCKMGAKALQQLTKAQVYRIPRLEAMEEC